MTLFRIPRLCVRTVISFVALTIGWCGLWRDVSAANLVSGAAVAALVLSLDVAPRSGGGLKPMPLLRFLGVVAVDLVRSTIDVAGAILSMSDSTDEAIIEVATPLHARNHVLLLVIAITVTPGTAVVDADPDRGTLYLHVLRYEHADTVRRHVGRLVELANEALPVEDARPEIPEAISS